MIVSIPSMANTDDLRPLPVDKRCDFSAADTAWVNRTIEAWHFINDTITHVSDIAHIEAIFFDASCQKNSPNVLSSVKNAIWQTRIHGNNITLPSGDSMPAIITSFTSSGSDQATFFVMSTPSIWQAGGVKSNMGLSNLMTPVMLHEATHAIQASTYGREIEVITARFNLPESFNDDSVQKLFENNSDFSESITDEIDLFMKAALAPTKIETIELARQAREKMKSRYAKWMSGESVKYQEIDAVWLSMEGFGQWLGYQWLIAPEGGGVTKEVAIEEFGLRGRWWSQQLGFALVLVIDRLSNNWKQDAFGNGNRTVLTLLDDALKQ